MGTVVQGWDGRQPWKAWEQGRAMVICVLERAVGSWDVGGRRRRH